MLCRRYNEKGCNETKHHPHISEENTTEAVKVPVGRQLEQRPPVSAGPVPHESEFRGGQRC